MLTVAMQSSNYKSLYPMSQNMHFIWTLNLFAKNGNCFFFKIILKYLRYFWVITCLYNFQSNFQIYSVIFAQLSKICGRYYRFIYPLTLIIIPYKILFPSMRTNIFINYYFSSDSISLCEKLFKVSKKGRCVTKFPYKHTFRNPLSQLLRLYMFP